MIKTFLLVFVLGFSNFSFAQYASTNEVTIRMEDVVQKVSQEDYEVYRNALKVYQANESVNVARGNLLPKLNFWRILSIPFDPKSLLNLVGDLVPFLIPSNWFQLKAQKQFALAQKESYKALWANEILTAKSLYLHLLLDQQLLKLIQDSQEDLKNLSTVVRSREILGGFPQGASTEIQVRILALDEDADALKTLVEEEMSILGQMMGYGALARLKLQEVAWPRFQDEQKFKFEDFEQR